MTRTFPLPTRTRRFASLALGTALACAPAPTHAPIPRTSASLLFLTDFGVKDGAVALCKGVMLDIDPALRIIDITHQVPPYDIETAAEVLEQTIPFYAAGTVTVAVVDPGVGSERKPIAILTKKGHLLVGPDNGIFTLVVESEGFERAVELRDRRYFRHGETSFTFHGRDVFSPVGAHLAQGTPIDSLGPPIVPVRLPLRLARLNAGEIAGTVRYIEDPYGNVVTNIRLALLDSVAQVGDSLDVRIGARSARLPWRHTFSDVAVGQPLAVMHERGLLSFSINQGDLASAWGVKRGDTVLVRRAPGGAPR
ncbi:MAG: S-adenosyl-l-methionine hydroxide adenosyltransferase family protein [Gemmatimonadaceae bacterium]